MAASDHLGPQFYHGTSGEHSFRPGDTLTPGGGRMAHVYYTSNLNTAGSYATYAQPIGENGRPDFNAEAVPGRVYRVQPETKAGRRIGKHAQDPWSGLKGNEDAFRTRGQLRVMHEVDRYTGEPL